MRFFWRRRRRETWPCPVCGHGMPAPERWTGPYTCPCCAAAAELAAMAAVRLDWTFYVGADGDPDARRHLPGRIFVIPEGITTPCFRRALDAATGAP